MRPEDGGPAYPATVGGGGGPQQVGLDTFIMPGMSLRDHFAGLAMAAIIGNQVEADDARECLTGDSYDEDGDSWCGPVAERAYDFADAMISARKANL